MERPLRILVVDDHPDCAESERLLLTCAGHTCRAAPNAAAAAEVAREFQPDVVLFEPGRHPEKTQLPGMLRRACQRAMRFVAISAWADARTRQKLAALGVFLYLAKPVDPDFLLDLLSSFLS